jgi:hypothetical protein
MQSLESILRESAERQTFVSTTGVRRTDVIAGGEILGLELPRGRKATACHC